MASLITQQTSVYGFGLSTGNVTLA